MTRRKEAYLNKKMSQFKLITIQECEFDEQYRKSEYAELLKVVEGEIDAIFIPPREFYTGG